MIISGELTDLDGSSVSAVTPFLTDVVVAMYNTKRAGSFPLCRDIQIAINQDVSVMDRIFTLMLCQCKTSDDIVSFFELSDNLRFEIVIDVKVL